MSNNRKLASLSLSLIILSCYLLYQGLNGDVSLNQLPSPTNSEEVFQTPRPSDQVLGESHLFEGSPSSQFKEQFQVLKVTDGDTIEVGDGEKTYKLRYIGVNTPETVDPRKQVECFGKKASEENKRLVEGKTIYTQKDISETDRYGRLLRFVYIKIDSDNYLFVNDYLVRNGFAYASTFPPDVKYKDRFEKAQGEAQAQMKGLWSECPIK